MSIIEELSNDELQLNVHRRNAVMFHIDECKNKLIKSKKYELDNIIVDDNHIGADALIRDIHDNIIREMNRLTKVMTSGDWSLSVESTKEREKEFKEE